MSARMDNTLRQRALVELRKRHEDEYEAILLEFFQGAGLRRPVRVQRDAELLALLRKWPLLAPLPTHKHFALQLKIDSQAVETCFSRLEEMGKIGVTRKGGSRYLLWAQEALTG